VTGVEFAERYGPWAVIAGASEGVGASVARLLGERGINVVLVARNQTTLDEVAATVATETRTVGLDLSRPDAAVALAAATSDLDVGLFVFNAGADPHQSEFLGQPIEVWHNLVVRNCVTVMATTHHHAGRMVERGRGGIVLVTSGAAWAGGSHLAAYSASKGFDLLLAESLWAELRPKGVDVLAMILGKTDTPAFRRVLAGREAGDMADPDDVARDMLDNLAEGPTFPPGPTPFGPVPRRQAVELMSQGAALLHDD
jgi:short-subunit dehydrogenase